MTDDNGRKFALFLSLLVAAITYFQPDEYSKEAMPKNVPVQDLLQSYHFIVVGSGSAGAVVANRLSEISHWNVLLIETGGNENELSDAPGLSGGNGDKMYWLYKTEPQKNSFFGYNNRQVSYLRGKVLGGSTVVNEMLYMRGDLRCFNDWEADGNYGWGSKEVLKYFIKAENNTIPYLVNSPFHGRDGPLTVSENVLNAPLVDAFITAGEELNYKVKDLNGAGGEGFMPTQLTIRAGERCSTSKAYLKSIRDRTNLHISMNSRVTKVLINDSKRAFGIRFIRDGQEYVIYAENEIILSAGSINSPQILMLSGVGPAEDLKKLKIPVVVDLPVGRTLQDHVGVFVVLIAERGSYNLLNLGAQDILDYAQNRSGKLSAGSIQATALLKSKYVRDDIPDIQLILSPNNGVFNRASLTGFGVNSKLYDATYGSLNESEFISIIATNVRTKSLGYVKLKTSNPLDAPLINPNYLSNPRDIDVLVEATKKIVALVETNSLKTFGVTYPNLNFPRCVNMKKNTDQYWRCFIRLLSGPGLHAASTCKMGINDDCVVDPRLLVYGVSGLRVIDASIMPRLTNANTNAPTIMIGERGADLIKEDYGQYFE